jgi:hypothetical protein
VEFLLPDIPVYHLCGGDGQSYEVRSWSQCAQKQHSRNFLIVPDTPIRNRSAQASLAVENKRFWLTIGVTLLTHAVLFAILASRTETLKPAVTSIMAVPEFLLWMIAAHWQMELADRKSKRVGSIS